MLEPSTEAAHQGVYSHARFRIESEPARVIVVSSTVVLSVTDPAASSRFFTTHLGYREVLTDEEFVALARDDAAPELVLRQRDLELPPGPGPVRVALSLTVTDVTAEDERLRRGGANITRPLRHEPWGELLLELTDPNGLVIQLAQWLQPAGA